MGEHNGVKHWKAMFRVQVQVAKKPISTLIAVSRLLPGLRDLPQPQSKVRENAGNLTETILNEHHSSEFSVFCSIYP